MHFLGSLYGEDCVSRKDAFEVGYECVNWFPVDSRILILNQCGCNQVVP